MDKAIKNREFYKDILQWDVNAWSIVLKFWEKRINWNKINKSLELGSGKGGLTLWLASKGINVVCSNYEKTKELSETIHNKYSIQDRVEYEDIDATNIQYENYFDLIVFKSIIGGIGKNNQNELQYKVFQECYKALKEGGILLFAENTSATIFHKILRKLFTKWGKKWNYPNYDNFSYFLKDFSKYEIHTTGFIALFGINETMRNFLHFFDRKLFNKIIPKKWKYICYGIAIK